MFEREKRCLGYTVLSTLYMSAFIGEMLVPAFLKVEKTNMTCFFFFLSRILRMENARNVRLGSQILGENMLHH